MADVKEQSQHQLFDQETRGVIQRGCVEEKRAKET